MGFRTQAFRGLLLGSILLAVARAVDLSGLIDNNPFGMAEKTPEKPAEQTQQFELRGVIKEREGYLPNIYEVATRKSVWVREGERVADFRLTGYDRSGKSVVLESEGRSLALALKSVLHRNRGPSGSTVNAPAFVAEPLRIKEVTLAAVAPPESEVQRMELVARQIRLRREQRRGVPAGSQL